MFATLIQAINKKFIFQVLVLFLPAALLAIVFAAYFYQVEKKKEFNTNSTSERAAVVLGKGSIDYVLDNINGDLYLIAQHSALEQLLKKTTPELLDHFSQDLLKISRSHPFYDQICWLDETGMERVRVNFNSGYPGIVATEKLQRRKDRDYFAETLKLAPGGIYVSPFELNSEQGKIEIPHKPMLRIGTPVADSDGNKRGVIVLDYLGNHLIRRFKAASSITGDHTMLLNRDGYYLKSPRPEDEWGFMFGKDELSLARSHPAAWQRISEEEEGQFLDAGGLWTFDTVYPLSGGEKFSSGIGAFAPGHSMLQAQNYQWKVVAHLPPDKLFANSGDLLKLISAALVLLLALLLSVSWKLARARMQSQLAENELRIAATAFESQEGMLITDANNAILRINSAFIRIVGYTAEEIIGKTPRMVRSGRHDANFYADMWKSIQQTGGWEGEIWNKRKNGEVFPAQLNITAVKDQNGMVTNYVAGLTDITVGKAAADEIKSLAFYDTLTGLPNRRLLLDRLKQALATSARSGRKGALLFIDLDNFKTLNDTLGHDIGDLLLQQVAQRLESCMRQGDTVARLGGDEFVVLLEDLNENALEAAEQTEGVGEKILAALNQPYQLAAHEHHNTPSIGVTLFSGHEQTQDELLKQADIAMYQAKKAGHNALRFFNPQMQVNVNAHVTLESELRRAVAEQEQFVIRYQGQIDSSGRIIGAEALVRWQHPVRGMLLPAEFIPLAEESGLILPLGHWVLTTVCRQLAAWAERAETAHLTVAVNVSAKQFSLPVFVQEVLALVDYFGVNPAKLKLEITESMLLDNVDDITGKMTALRARGIRFSMDDFGAGYSSLQYLKRLPLDQLKIDQSFVRDIDTDDSDKAIVRTIIAMAKSLNLSVIAEGVETEAQRQRLLNKGCTAYQGHLFGSPAPIEQFEALLEPGRS